MNSRFLLLPLTFSLLLSACGGAPGTPATTTSTDLASITGATPTPTNLREARDVPPALGQILGLQRVITQGVSVQSIKTVSSLTVNNPAGIPVVRVDVFGPRTIDPLREPFGEGFTYSVAGANTTQDRVYSYGEGQHLSDKLHTTLKAIGGHEQVQQVITSNFIDLMIQTRSGAVYLAGKTTPMTANEIANTREEYAALMKAYEQRPEGFALNAKIWEAMAGTSNEEPTGTGPLNTAALNAYTRPDGMLDVTRAMQTLKGGVTASELKLMPAALRSLNGNNTAINGKYTYNGTMPGGGWAQESLYWGDYKNKGTPGLTVLESLDYYTYSFVGGPWNSPYYQKLIGCSASSAQALIHDIYRKGYPVDGQTWTRKFKTNNYNSGWNDALYSVGSGVRNDSGLLMPEEFPTYHILNQKNLDGANFSTAAMNAGHHNGSVANTVFDIGHGINQMLTKVWPQYFPAGLNYVWSEYKTAGAGSNGTMREILASKLPAGRTVVVAHPLGGTSGHTSTVYTAELISYRSWMFWTGYDAYVTTMDHPNEKRLLTGTTVPASGVYTVNY